ncbi:MAG TPA: hypothetical protein VF736_05210 [Pyrinomonadaceae bacterium]|jgi:hypothetical protein
MAEQDRAGEADRFAHGTGRSETKQAEQDSFRPGETGGAGTTLPDTGRAGGAGAGLAEGTQGAVGEMDFTGAPAGPAGGSGPSGGSGAGASQGGGPGGGSVSGGGTGPGVAGPGPQSIQSTTAALGDMEPSAGSGGASRAETDNDDDSPPSTKG